MKPYTVHVDIDLPRDRVLELFDDADNLIKWQTDFVSFEPLSGDPGQVGAKAKLTYQMGKKTVELIETVTVRELPERFDGTYEWGGGWNELENRFIVLAPDKTRWESTCTYHMKSPMLRVMGFLMPGMFKKQNQKLLDQFKAFCETGADVRDQAR